ncbi:MAG: hypothetical protein AAF348_00860 [Bacteroidota bacterium]
MKKFSLVLSFCFIFVFTIKINAQELTIFEGFWEPEFYQDDKQISKKEFKKLIENNNQAANYWKKAELNSTLTFVALIGQVGTAVWSGYELSQDDGDALGPALGSLGFGILGGVFLHLSNQNRKNTILTYNRQFDNKTTFRLVPTNNRNGVGLALKF